MGGAALAARYGALSCDHIEHLSRWHRRHEAAGTVAVLLPGAYYTLRDTHLPPIRALRDAGVPMAVSTDHNPALRPPSACCSWPHGLHAVPPDGARGLGRHHHHAARALGLQDCTA